VLTLNVTLVAIAFAAEPSATPSAEPTSSPQAGNNSSAEIEAIAQLDKDYEAAYNRGNANSVAAFYTNDAEYVDEGGNVVSGRAAIEKLLAEEFTTNPGAKLQIDAEGVRLLSPDVLVEKGVATIASAEGSQGASRYVAVYLNETRWRLENQSVDPNDCSLFLRGGIFATPREAITEAAQV
jgi:uncharacterized protein (TIGR02246 family)